MDSLQSKIGEGEALSTDLASYQTWIDRNGHSASLNALSKTLDDVTAQVSEYICYVLEKIENQRLLDGFSGEHHVMCLATNVFFLPTNNYFYITEF